MYKPQYLNVEREVQNIYSGNQLYLSKVTTKRTGYKKSNVQKKCNKSGRRFKSKLFLRESLNMR